MNGETVASVTETSPGTLATAGVAGSPYAITPKRPGRRHIHSLQLHDRLREWHADGESGGPDGDGIQHLRRPTARQRSWRCSAPPGLVNGETIGSVTETSPARCDRRRGGQSVCDHAKQRSGGTFTPSNYTITFVNGALTVNPAGADGDGDQCLEDLRPDTHPDGLYPGGPGKRGNRRQRHRDEPRHAGDRRRSGQSVCDHAKQPGRRHFHSSNYTISFVNGALTVNPAP